MIHLAVLLLISSAMISCTRLLLVVAGLVRCSASLSGAANRTFHGRPVSSIQCPSVVHSHENDRDYVVHNMVIAFDCSLTFASSMDKANYTLSFVLKPLFNPALVGCSHGFSEECLSPIISFKADFVSIEISFNISCANNKVLYKYALFSEPMLLSTGIIQIIFGKTPPQPGDISIRSLAPLLNSSRLPNLEMQNFINAGAFLESIIEEPSCVSDANASTYYIDYTLQGQACSSKRTEVCKGLATAYGSYLLTCSLSEGLRDCPQEDICHVLVSAFTWGVNAIGTGSKSRPFRQLFALVSLRSINLRVSHFNSTQLSVEFDKPVPCTSALSLFQYKVTLESLDSVYLDEQSDREFLISYCKTEISCRVTLLSLAASAHYKVCVRYLSVLDYMGTFSKPTCIYAHTSSSHPTETPRIENILPVKVDSLHWKAVVTWKAIPDEQWHSSNRRYELKLIALNSSTVILWRALASDSSSFIVKPLYYGFEYALELSACNEFGCVSGRPDLLQVDEIYNGYVKVSGIFGKRKLTELILVCVVAVLFVASAAVLVFVLRKRKLFKRLPLHSASVMDDTLFVASTSYSRGVESSSGDRMRSIPSEGSCDLADMESSPLTLDFHLSSCVATEPSLSTISEGAEEDAFPLET